MTLKVVSVLAVAVAMGAAQPALARWANWPPPPSDAQLEQIVRAAYIAAAAHARGHTNYFARDEAYEPLRIAIEDELGRQGLTFVEVATASDADLKTAPVCSDEGTELRVAVNMFGDGLTLAAVSTERAFSYHYDPHEDAAIVVTPAQACVKT